MRVELKRSERAS